MGRDSKNHTPTLDIEPIANLVKMLGQEKFIKMINSVPQQICFIQQNPMAKKE